MREGGLDAPTRHVIPWEDPDFFDRTKTEAEMRRIFDICHGCRRCFNLCDAFPRLFDLVDNSDTGELVRVGELPRPPAGAKIQRVDVIIRIRQDNRAPR